MKDRIADVVPFEAEAFAKAMERMLIDGEHYEKRRSECQSMMKDTFSISAVVDKLECVYEAVVKGISLEAAGLTD